MNAGEKNEISWSAIGEEKSRRKKNERKKKKTPTHAWEMFIYVFLQRTYNCLLFCICPHSLICETNVHGFPRNLFIWNSESKPYICIVATDEYFYILLVLFFSNRNFRGRFFYFFSCKYCRNIPWKFGFESSGTDKI